MDDFTNIFEQATAAVELGYFHLHIHGGSPVYRERVYCYELYHQMRVRWPPDCPFTLNGEIDKAAHPILTGLGADRAKPDFLIHTPGAMAGNFAIVEVKPQGAANDDIRIDLEKLWLFTSAVGYQRAIYLLYGHGPGQAMERVLAIREESAERFGSVELWVHDGPGRAAARYA